MTFSLQCDRCKKHSKNDKEYNEFRQLDYYKKGLGHYHTIHLCQKCSQILNETFMRGSEEPAKHGAAESETVFPPEQG